MSVCFHKDTNANISGQELESLLPTRVKNQHLTFRRENVLTAGRYLQLSHFRDLSLQILFEESVVLTSSCFCKCPLCWGSRELIRNIPAQRKHALYSGKM